MRWRFATAALPRRAGRSCAFLFLGLCLAACVRSQPPPSFALVVLDTVRADAVSSYGHVTATTPNIDALARTGLRYAHAYSNSNWTLPAHASLFTGVLPDRHGVVLGGDALPDGFTTLAEHLSRRGYETVGFSENPWVDAATRMDRGFERYSPVGKWTMDDIGRWLAARPRERPFFLFLNVMDAHWPYQVRATNPFLPPGVEDEAAGKLARDPGNYCVRRRGHPDLAILHGLYLGDVQAADAKLGRVLRWIEEANPAEGVVVIVTSDHGECFGERGLIEHGLGLGEAVLRVPLVVHGLRRVPPAVIDTPVQLVDIAPSILSWAGAPTPDGFAGRSLPTRNAAGDSRRVIIAEHSDAYTNERASAVVRGLAAWRRSPCSREDKIFGDIRAVLRRPYKLIWYEEYAPELFDLRSDPEEEHDLAPTDPRTVAALTAELEAMLGARAAPDVPAANLGSDAAERLRALGYLVEKNAPAP